MKVCTQHAEEQPAGGQPLSQEEWLALLKKESALSKKPDQAKKELDMGAAMPYNSTKKGLVVVTAADYTHWCPLLNLIRDVRTHNPHTLIVVYDLAASGQYMDIKTLANAANAVGTTAGPDGGILLRRFPYGQYPRFFYVNESAGEYAWKPVIIKKTVDEFGLVLWLDAGNGVSGSFMKTQIVLQTQGFATNATVGNYLHWTHTGMRKYFSVNDTAAAEWTNCNAALVGISRDSWAYDSILQPWYKCALDRACIAPSGSSRANHRQDQAALSTVVGLSGRYRCSGCQGGHGCLPGGEIQLRAGDYKLHPDGRGGCTGYSCRFCYIRTPLCLARKAAARALASANVVQELRLQCTHCVAGASTALLPNRSSGVDSSPSMSSGMCALCSLITCAT